MSESGERPGSGDAGPGRGEKGRMMSTSGISKRYLVIRWDGKQEVGWDGQAWVKPEHATLMSEAEARDLASKLDGKAIREDRMFNLDEDEE